MIWLYFFYLAFWYWNVKWTKYCGAFCVSSNDASAWSRRRHLMKALLVVQLLFLFIYFFVVSGRLFFLFAACTCKLLFFYSRNFLWFRICGLFTLIMLQWKKEFDWIIIQKLIRHFFIAYHRLYYKIKFYLKNVIFLYFKLN